MDHDQLFPVPAAWAQKAWADDARYQAMYRLSVENPEGFWGEQGKRIDWIRPYSKVKDVSYAKEDLHIRWYHDGSLNVAANCIDRHLARRADQVAVDAIFGNVEGTV